MNWFYIGNLLTSIAMAHQTEKLNRIERETKKIALVNEFVQSIDFTVNSYFSTFESQKNKKGVGATLGPFSEPLCCFCCPGIFLLVAVDKNVLFVLPTWGEAVLHPKSCWSRQTFLSKAACGILDMYRVCFCKKKDSSNGIGFSPQESPVYQT